MTCLRGNPGLSGSFDGDIRKGIEPVWKTKIGFTESLPVVVAGKVCIGTRQGLMGVLEAASGKVLFSAKFEQKKDEPPTIHTVPAWHNESIVFASRSGEVGRLDIGTQKWVWLYDAKKPFNNSAVTDGKSCYIAGESRKLHAIDWETGKESWSKTAADDILASPALKGDRLFCTLGNALFAINAVDGGVLWERTFGDTTANQTPVIHGDHLYLTVFKHLHVMDCKTGDVLHSLELPGKAGIPTISDQLIVVTLAGMALAAYDRNFKELWTTGKVKKFDTVTDVAAAILVGDTVVSKDSDGILSAYDGFSGEQLWQLDEEFNGDANCTYGEGLLLTINTDGELCAFRGK